MEDYEIAVNLLTAKADRYTRLMAYVDGDQPLKYSTRRLQEAFRDITAHFNQNWLDVIVSAAVDRMQFNGWTVEDEGANDLLTEIYNEQELAIELEDAIRMTLITHEAFIIAWPDADGEQVYYNDPRMCCAIYDPENPKRLMVAGKWYQAGDLRWHLTLYYPDRLEYYVTRPVKMGYPKASLFLPDETPTAVNPFGVIPVFHLQINRKTGKSDITGVITLQDAVNKLFADMMVSAEFSAWRQRWIISEGDTTTLKNAPNEIWHLPEGSQVGEFAGGGLDNFLNAIDKIASSMAIISRTPKHFLFTTGANISGEALIAMEAPLVARVENHIQELTPALRRLGAFLLQMRGVVVPQSDVGLVWQPAQSVQPVTEAQTIKTLREAGIPLDTVLRWAGKSETEIAGIMETVDAEKKQAQKQADLLFAKMQAEQHLNEGVQATEEQAAEGQNAE